MRLFLTFAATQFVAFMLLITNLRAIDELQYVMAAVTELAYLTIQWSILKRVVDTDAWQARLGYIVGGTSATVTSMWLTKGWS